MLKQLLFGMAALTVLGAQAQFRTDFRHSTENYIGQSQDVTVPLRHRAMSTTSPNGLGVYGQSSQGSVPSIGHRLYPVVMVSFPDLAFQETTTQDKINRWLSEPGYNDETHAIGSVSDYFNENSYGLFVPTFEVVATVTMSHPYAYYGAHSGNSKDAHPAELVREAIDLAVAKGVDFSKYATDGTLPIVSIVHAGPGEHEDAGYKYNDPNVSPDDYIWAHYSALGHKIGSTNVASYIITNELMRNFDNSGNIKNTRMTGIGTFCHEFLHALGLTDDYDHNGSIDGEGQTPGMWDVMDYQFIVDGYRPCALNAYQRCCLGWLDIPELPIGTDIALCPLDATTNPDGNKRAYRITNPDNPKEYFILENRQPSTWHLDTYRDMMFFGKGMLIWHIDYDAAIWNSNHPNTKANHQHIAVVPADGKWQYASYGTNDFAGDLFPGTNKVTTFDNRFANYYTGNLDACLVNIKQHDDGLITFQTGTLSDIRTIHTEKTTTPRYDLLGRPTRAPQGLWIESGRKIMK